MKRSVLLTIFLLACASATYVTLFFLTDAAYNSLEASEHRTKADIQRILKGFREELVANPEEMQPVLRGKLKPGWQYRRYTKYLSFSIDVVYDERGDVYSIWPEYE